MTRKSASERSVVKLFDAYIYQGIDIDNAIVLVRASLGLSNREVEDALQSAGRLNYE